LCPDSIDNIAVPNTSRFLGRSGSYSAEGNPPLAGDVQDHDALAPLLRNVHRKRPFVTMCFVDRGYAGDEAQRAAYEASRIAITVVKRTDKQIKGFVVLPKRGGRKNARLDQSRPASRQGFRGNYRVCARLVAHRPGFPAHAQDREALTCARVISSQALRIEPSFVSIGLRP
jgi:hypothetical protein